MTFIKFVPVFSLLTIALSGCGGAAFEKATTETAAGNRAMQEAHAKQEATNLFELDLWEDGKVKSIKVGRQSQAPVYAPMPIDPSYAILDKTLGIVGTVGGIVAGGAAAKGIITATSAGNVAISKMIQAPATPVVVQTPQANITSTTTNTPTSTNTTLSGTGVIGSGTFSAPTTTTSTISGTGVIGGGSYTNSNPVTNTLAGGGVIGAGSYTPTTNTFNGNGVLGSGSYTPTQTTNTLAGNGVLGAGSYTPTTNSLTGPGVIGAGTYTAPIDNHSATATPTVVTQPPPLIVNPVIVPAIPPTIVTNPTIICTTDSKGVQTCVKQ